MSVYVCLKQVPNLEGLPEVQPETGFVRADAWFLNPLDGFALCEALRAAKELSEACVAVSVGGQDAATAEAGLRLALSLGAERAVLVSPVPALAGSGLTAACLAAAIRADCEANSEADGGAASLVFCGRQAIDVAGMQTPYRLAAGLECGVIGDVASWSVQEGVVRAVSQGGSLRRIMEAELPCVLALNRGVGDMPRPTLPGMLRARKLPVRVVTPEEIGVVADDVRSGDPVLLRTRNPRGERRLRMAEGTTLEEKVRNLVDMLRRDGCPL